VVDLTNVSDAELADRLVRCDSRIRAMAYSPLQGQLQALTWEFRAEMDRRKENASG
jgi:hypothetical protein